MDAKDIYQILKSDPRASSCFQGVYPSDKLPEGKISYPSAFVANIDKSHEKGSHWIAFFFDKLGEASYFDSYGFYPLLPTFEKFLDRHAKGKIKYNNTQLQSLFSTTCGAYVIFYIMHRARGFSMESIVNMFDSRDQAYNDRHIHEFIQKHANLNFPIVDIEFITNQISRAYYGK